METGLIYKWRCLESGKEYIGQTMLPEKRKWEFLAFHKNYAGVAINRARKKYDKEELWEYSVLEEVSSNTTESLKEGLDVLERKYIKDYSTLVPNGYNITDGGGGITIDGKPGYWNGKRRNEDTKQKIGEANKGTYHSRESIERGLAKRHKTLMAMSEERRNEIRMRLSEARRKVSVYQYAKNGDLIEVYKSIKEAAEKTGIDDSIISECVRNKYNGNRSDYRGFLFSSTPLDKKEIDEYDFNQGKWRKGDIYLYNRDFELLKVFKTQAEVSRYFGVSKSVAHHITSKLSTNEYHMYKKKYILSEKEINDNNISKIYKFTNDGKLLEIFNGMEFIPNGYDKRCIRKCLSNSYGINLNRYKKYRWSNSENVFIKPKKVYYTRKKEKNKSYILKKDKDGKIIEKFSSVKDVITKYPTFNMSSIYMCLQKKYTKKVNFYKKFYWEWG